jgi:hypothetical protein
MRRDRASTCDELRRRCGTQILLELQEIVAGEPQGMWQAQGFPVVCPARSYATHAVQTVSEERLVDTGSERIPPNQQNPFRDLGE